MTLLDLVVFPKIESKQTKNYNSSIKKYMPLFDSYLQQVSHHNNFFDEGGITNNSNIAPEEAAVNRANQVYSNYAETVDNPLNPLQQGGYNILRFLKDNIWEGIPSGVSNCTLTATQWVDPNVPIKQAPSITHNPQKYNYTQINSDDAVPGNLVITKVPNQERYHTMMITGFADKDGTYNFDGKYFPYKKGEPLLTYSRGGHDNSFIRKNVPLSVYTVNSDGHTENMFFRYNYPNEVFLPEIVITTKKRRNTLMTK